MKSTKPCVNNPAFGRKFAINAGAAKLKKSQQNQNLTESFLAIHGKVSHEV
jgi:hypothetical protein